MRKSTCFYFDKIFDPPVPLFIIFLSSFSPIFCVISSIFSFILLSHPHLLFQDRYQGLGTSIDVPCVPSKTLMPTARDYSSHIMGLFRIPTTAITSVCLYRPLCFFLHCPAYETAYLQGYLSLKIVVSVCSILSIVSRFFLLAQFIPID